MARCLAAFTPPGTSPPYINASLHVTARIVRVHVRDDKGVTVAMDFRLEEWSKFLGSAVEATCELFSKIESLKD